MRLLFSLVAVLAIQAVGVGQTMTWVRRYPVTSAPGRQDHAMAYDSTRKKVVLQGGWSASDTWEYDGMSWVRINSPIPMTRFGNAMAYDSARKKVVLFGGKNYSGGWVYQDTWEYDGKSWVEIKTNAIPNHRFWHTLVYDSARKKVVMFGGRAWFGQMWNDTWEYDGKSWIKIKAAVSPSVRYGHGMVYDSIRKKVVLFGGADSNGVHKNDTWEYDGESWSQLILPVSPPPRKSGAMAFDQTRRRVVLFGGQSVYNYNSIYFNDTWEFSGNSWELIKLNSSPSVRRGPAMVYDSARKAVVLFGGGVGAGTINDNDTWELSSYYSGIPSSFGSGCYLPTPLTITEANSPAIGKTFLVNYSNLPTTAKEKFLVIGLSRTISSGLPLPFHLGPYHATGCYLNCSIDLMLTYASLPLQISLPIPSVPALIGGRCYFQLMAYVPNVNPFGLLTSNGLEIVIGN